MQSIISAFINGALSAYMAEVSSGSITGSLAHKNLGIAELEVYPDAILQHGLPILIKKGIIKNVDIQAPPKIMSEPTKITIESVTILASIYTKHPTPSEMINMKIRLLKAYKFFRRRYKPVLGFLQKDSFLSIFRTIMSNVIIEINHLHIRIEYSSKISLDVTDQNSPSSSPNSPLETKYVVHEVPVAEEEKKTKHTLHKKGSTKDVNDDDSDESSESTSADDISPSARFAIYDKYNQDEQHSKTKVTAIGVIMKQLILHNPDNYEAKSNTKITKEVVFSDLAVYMDAEQPPVDTTTNEQCLTQMEEIYNSKDHNWMVNPFSFSSLVKFEKGLDYLLIEPIMKTIIVNIREEYIPLLLEFMKAFDTYFKVISVAHIPKSTVDYPQSFWRYIHNCALTKISNPTYEFTQSLSLLVKRAIFIRNYKKKNEESLAIIKEMEETLDYSTIVAFRAAYRRSHRKKKAKGKSKITSRTTDKIINDIKIDPVYMVTAMIDMLSINMKGELVTIALRRNPGKKHVVVDIKNPNLIFTKDLKSYKIHATISYICVKYKNGKDKSIVFKSVDNSQSEMKVEMMIPFHSYSNWSASLEVSKNNYTVNLKPLFQIVADLSHLKFAESSMNSESIIAFMHRRKFELNVQVHSSVIKIVGSKSTRAIEYAFDKFSFSTDTKTLERTLKLNNSWISFITNSVAKVSSDFSIIGSMVGKKVTITIPLFSCKIPFKYIVVIQDFIDLFMQYQNLIKVDSFPKIDIDFKLDMKGIDVDLNITKHKKKKIVQIRRIKLKYNDSVFNFKLSSIKMSKLFSLRDLKAKFDKKSLDVKLKYISAKIIDLIELVPKDALQIIQSQNALPAPVENDAETDNDSDSSADTKSEVSEMKKDKSIELPKIKIGFKIETCKVDLKLTEDEDVKFRVKDIKASMGKNKITADALLEKIKVEHLVIAKQTQFQAEIILGKMIEVMLKASNFNLDIDQKLINLLFGLKFQSPKVVLPQDLGLKISFVMNQMTISNDFVMKNLKTKITINNSKVKGKLGMDSVDSSIMKFQSKDLIKLKADILEKSIDLDINLKEITLFVIPLIDVISMIPLANLPKTDPPQINLNLNINPIGINFVFAEDYLNIILNSPAKLKINTIERLLPYVSVQTSDFSINLNNSKIVGMKSINFVLDKNIDIDIPSIIVMVSMVRIYKLIKMITVIIQSSFITTPQQKQVSITKVPIERITCKVPLIQLLMQQTKSRRNVSLNFENTEFFLKNSETKAELFGETRGILTASDGFLSFDLTQHFKIQCTGELADNKKVCSLEIQDPIILEITAFTINQILKNLTATEDDAEQQYSISNETGAEISIIVNNNEYKLKSQEYLPNITDFADLDIKVKIGDITNPFQLYSTYSKISTPLYFDKNFILVWMDTKKLQLRLLSPISFKNKSNMDLEIQVNDTEFKLKDGDFYSLNYTIQKLDTIIVKYEGSRQQVHLADSSVIKLSDKFIVVSRKRKIETLRTTISFKAPYYFRNELISTIVISIKGEKKNTVEQVQIKPYEVVPIPFFLPALEIISFDIMDTNEFKGIHVDLKLDDIKDKRDFISTKDKNGKEFILQFSMDNKKMNIISISPFLIYYNSLPIPLIFGLSDEEDIVREKILDLNESLSEFFPFQNSQNIWKINNPVMVSPLIDDTKDVKIYISSIYSSLWSPDPISISNFDSSADLVIPINDEVVSLARVHALSNSNLQPNTFIFFMSPKYAINNQTNETFSVDLFNGQAIEIPPNSTISVTFIRKSLQFSVALVPKSKKKKQSLSYSSRLDIEKINSQYINVAYVESPVLFQLSVEKDIRFLTMMLNRTLPYLFINKTDLKVIFIQKDTADSAHTVMPKESLPFFLFDENMPSIIVCEIRNEIKFELDVNKPSFPVEIQYKKQKKDTDLFYFVDLSASEGSAITLVDAIGDAINIPINLNMNSNDSLSSQLGLATSLDESSINISVADLPKMKNNSISFSSVFSQISIMIITDRYQELCNITLKDICINSVIKDFETNTEVAIGSIKVDDQSKYAVYPSVFQILPSGNRPAILFKVNSFGSHKYGKIEFEVRPINIQVDLSFISDLIGDIFYFDNTKSVKSQDSDDGSDSNDDDDDNSSENITNEQFKFKMNELPFAEIMHNIMPKQTKYHINKIIIHPFIIHTTFRTTTTRSFHPLQTKYEINRLVNFIPSFNNMSIAIDDEHYFLNLSGTTDEIVFKISHEVKQIILNQLSIRSSIIGTKKMVVKAIKGLFKPDSATNATKGIINKTSLVLSIAESTLCYVSSMLDIYTNAPPNIRTDVTSYEALTWGVHSLTSSFSEGAKDLVSETRHRGNVNGRSDYCGYIVGSGIGLTKCIAHMTSGVCVFGASLFSSTRRLFSEEKVVFIDKREREPLLGMHCSDKDHLLWYTGSLFACLIEVYGNSIYISKGDIFIPKFTKAEIKKTEVIIYDDKENTYGTTFDNENQAIAFYSIVQSQLLRRKLLETHIEKTMDEGL